MGGPRSATGSCVRCQRKLDLASVKVDGAWYCRASCAAGLAPAPDAPRVPEIALLNRPRRAFRKRLPKELRAAETETGSDVEDRSGPKQVLA
jgi:hypothetical protein